MDGNTLTNSVTLYSAISWWEGQLEKSTKVTKFLVHTSTYALDQGFYKKFKVETKKSLSEDWRICKDTFSIKDPPVMVTCDEPSIVKYVKLSVAGDDIAKGVPFYLLEVNVVGSIAGNNCYL